ncbi:MAG: 30S ribosome-binding factor RbfA [Thermoleophilia bacterium]
MRRVNESLKEVIGTALTREIKDPRIGFVTVTGVDTAPDFSHAKVFFSVYGKQAEKDATLQGLRAARPYLQRLISDELDLKRTPNLEFVYDASIDQGMRIQAILKAGGAAGLPPEETAGLSDSLGPSGVEAEFQIESEASEDAQVPGPSELHRP